MLSSKLTEERIIARARSMYIGWVENGNNTGNKTIADRGIYSWLNALYEASNSILGGAVSGGMLHFGKGASGQFANQMLEMYGEEKIFERVAGM